VRKFEVYVETSVWGAAADVDPAYYRRESARLLAKGDKFVFYVSTLVLDEIEAAAPGVKETVNSILEGAAVTALENNEEVVTLARAYVDRGAFPRRYVNDAIHVACASVFGVPYLVSYNFRHIVRPSTRNLVKAVNTILGYNTPELLSPEELLAEAGEE
jgi:predicted nucleic acid-binding protein